MTYTPLSMPPEAYLNPYAASAVPLDMLILGVRRLIVLIRKNREVSKLNRIAVLPSGWDAVGRQCDHR